MQHSERDQLRDLQELVSSTWRVLINAGLMPMGNLLHERVRDLAEWKRAIDYQLVTAMIGTSNQFSANEGLKRIIDWHVAVAMDYAVNGGRAIVQVPINMVLFCPECKLQHLDAPEPPTDPIHNFGGWDNPPHRTHLCAHCGCKWRPADIPTNGVPAVQTRGGSDTWPPAGYDAAMATLASRIARAATEDDTDISNGIFGPRMSALIKELAAK